MNIHDARHCMKSICFKAKVSLCPKVGESGIESLTTKSQSAALKRQLDLLSSAVRLRTEAIAEGAVK